MTKMYWQLIQKISEPSLDGNYKNPAVRGHLRKEAKNHCVYCAINENRVGGEQAFHVDHYRPKSRAEFEHLAHKLSNLFYACPICNRFKGSKWKNEPRADHSIIAIPDPSQVDYSTLFDVDSSTGKVSGKYVASRYVVQELYLDRPQLQLERRRVYLESKQKRVVDDLVQKIDRLKQVEATELISQLSIALAKQLELSQQEKDIPYYELQDVTR